MKLEVWKPLTYISPSSLMTFEACSFKTYLTRMAGLPYAPREQSLAAAIGSYFDALVKWDLEQMLQTGNPKAKFSRLIKDNLTYEPIVEAKETAEKIFMAYKQQGYIQQLLDLGLNKVELEVYLDKPVPILGKPDAACCRADGKDIPFDWKTKGFTSVKKSYHCNKIPENWMIQITMYNWMLNDGDMTTPPQGIIHEIMPGPVSNISVKEHKVIVPREFEMALNVRLMNMWNTINHVREVDIPPACASLRKCNMYGSLCEAAVHCGAYAEMLE